MSLTDIEARLCGIAGELSSAVQHRAAAMDATGADLCIVGNSDRSVTVGASSVPGETVTGPASVRVLRNSDVRVCQRAPVRA